MSELLGIVGYDSWEEWSPAGGSEFASNRLHTDSFNRLEGYKTIANMAVTLTEHVQAPPSCDIILAPLFQRGNRNIDVFRKWFEEFKEPEGVTEGENLLVGTIY